jgi:energy-coupling factor transporter ATP-binding protein EcfA2
LDIDRAGEVYIVRIWEAERKTILFVTHDIDEAVQLAGRVLVMSRPPATIRQAVEIDLPRRRDLNSPAYLERREQIFAVMGMSPHGKIARDWPGRPGALCRARPLEQKTVRGYALCGTNVIL